MCAFEPLCAALLSYHAASASHYDSFPSHYGSFSSHHAARTALSHYKCSFSLWIDQDLRLFF